VTVIAWLLDSDPAIRWQVMRDLTDAPAGEVAAERAKITTEGWGAELLSNQGTDGSWAGAAWNPGNDSTMHVLWLLANLGIDPECEQSRSAVAVARANVKWVGWGPDGGDNPFFTGEVEPCINGQLAMAAAYFRQNVDALIDRLLTEQMVDGGWNCEAENGSTRGSFNTTICVLEALLASGQTGSNQPNVAVARAHGDQYLLDRQLYKRLSTGEPITVDRKRGNDWTQFAFPTWWHYDILRGLDYLREGGVTPDERVAAAIEIVRSKQQLDGRWLLDIEHPGTAPIDFGETAGEPSRWITLRALRVLRWYDNDRREVNT
jgi:hypothetical protein